LVSVFMRGSAMIFCQASSRAAREAQVVQPNATVSPAPQNPSFQANYSLYKN